MYGSRRLVVFEVVAEGFTAFTVRRDESGTPRGRAGPRVPWDAGGASWAQAMAERISTGTAVILVCASPGSPPANEAMESVRSAHPEALTFAEANVRVAELLRQVIADEPLWQSYDLVVLKRHPLTNGIQLACHPLFGIEARRGESAEVIVQCEPSDEHGTMFAVVTWQDRLPHLLSVHAAKLAPGRYQVVAELERPGRVRFPRLPGLIRCNRSWDELVASIPARLEGQADPAHLICAVEVGGPGERVDERLDRVGQLVAVLSDDPQSAPRVSLVVYGSHAFERGVPEEPVHVACWQATADHAQETLHLLEERLGRVPPARGYAYAAQVEDMLAEVTTRIALGGAAPTALLTIGDRPPHPPRVHPSEVLPCPRRIDWEGLTFQLEQRPALMLGAIRDRPSGRSHPAWARLGRDVLTHLAEVDIEKLGADLGLVVAEPQQIPFPFLAVS